MTAADWLAVWAGAPTFIAAVTALVVALRANGTSKANAKSLAAHPPELLNTDARPVAGLYYMRMRLQATETVHAGAEGDERSIVCALDLSPTQLRIAGYAATSPPGGGNRQPEIASLRDGRLVAETWNPKEKPPALTGG